MRKKKFKVRLVGYNERPPDAPSKKVLSGVVVIIIILSLFSLGMYALLGHIDVGEDNDNHPQEDILRAVVDQGFNVDIWRGETVTLTAQKSTGDIERYVWVMGDLEVNESSFTYRFMDVGRYRVRLWVYSADDQHSTTCMVHVSYKREGVTGKTSTTDPEYHYSPIPVEGDDNGMNTLVRSVNIYVMYPKGSFTENRLGLDVFDGDGKEIENATIDTYESETEKFINWSLSSTQWLVLCAPGDWSLNITQRSLMEVSFTIDIYVMY